MCFPRTPMLALEPMCNPSDNKWQLEAEPGELSGTDNGSSSSCGSGCVRRHAPPSPRREPYSLSAHHASPRGGASSTSSGCRPEAAAGQSAASSLLDVAIGLASQSLGATIEHFKASCAAPPESPLAAHELEEAEAEMEKTLRRTNLAVTVATSLLSRLGEAGDAEHVRLHKEQLQRFFAWQQELVCAVAHMQLQQEGPIGACLAAAQREQLSQGEEEEVSSNLSM